MNDNNPQSTVRAESLGESAAQPWMGDGMKSVKIQRLVNAYQLTSLSAMIAYIAEKTGYSEFRIERDLSDRFHVPNAKCLAQADFDQAIRYLADILAA